jgi:hypothetical protein
MEIWEKKKTKEKNKKWEKNGLQSAMFIEGIKVLKKVVQKRFYLEMNLLCRTRMPMKVSLNIAELGKI